MPAGRIELPVVIGHRGARAHAPENTLVGFRAAARLGVRWVELDARLTADSRLAVIHDATLDRTTDGAGPVRAATMATIAALDAGSWFGPDFTGEPVPALEEALGLIAELGMGVNIELKADPALAEATAAAVARAVAAAWPSSAPLPLLSSFEPACLSALHRIAGGLPRGVVMRRAGTGWRNLVRAADAASLHLDHSALDRATVETVKAEGLTLATFTVNDADRARTLVGWGVDALFSDRPRAVAQAL